MEKPKFDPRRTRGEHYASGGTPEEYRIKGGTSDYPESRKKMKGDFIPTEQIRAKGLTPEEELIQREERNEIRESVLGSDSAGLELADWQAQEARRRSELRHQEMEEGWSPTKKPAEMKPDLKIAAEETEKKFDKVTDKERIEEGFKVDRFLGRTARTEIYKNKNKPGQDTVREKAA